MPIRDEKTDLIVSRYVSDKFYNKSCIKRSCCSKAERFMKTSYKVECRLDKTKVDDVYERMKIYNCGETNPKPKINSTA